MKLAVNQSDPHVIAFLALISHVLLYASYNNRRPPVIGWGAELKKDAWAAVYQMRAEADRLENLLRGTNE